MPKKAVFERSRRELSFDVSGRCSRPLGCRAIEPGKSVKGVCQDSDTYGTFRRFRRFRLASLLIVGGSRYSKTRYSKSQYPTESGGEVALIMLPETTQQD